MVASAATPKNEEKPYPPKWAFHFGNALQRKNCWVRCPTITLLKSTRLYEHTMSKSKGFQVYIYINFYE
jgi:hypothetical protein